MRRLAAGIGVAAALGFAASPAVPKEGVRAIADTPVDLTPAAGSKVRVKWHLVDADGHAFRASGIYLRVSRCGRKPLRIRAHERGKGHYSARFRAPRRGIRKLTVGLEGWRSTPGGHTERADMIFNFMPALGRRCS